MYSSKDLETMARIIHGERPNLVGPYRNEAAVAIGQTVINELKEGWADNLEGLIQYWHGYREEGSVPKWAWDAAAAVLNEWPVEDHANGATHLRSLLDLENHGQEDVAKHAVYSFYHVVKEHEFGLYGFTESPEDLERNERCQEEGLMP